MQAMSDNLYANKNDFSDYARLYTHTVRLTWTAAHETMQTGLRGKELRGNAARGSELRGNGARPKITAAVNKPRVVLSFTW